MTFLRATAAPPTLTARETKTLLEKTGKEKGAEREHMIYSLALGSALREHEITALNVGDVLIGGAVRSKVHLTIFKGANVKPARARAAARPRKAIRQVVYLPRAVRRKLDYYLKLKKKNGEDVSPAAPLFSTSKPSFNSTTGDRISTRTVRHHFRVWQRRCDFETLHGFHVLRHTALSNLYRVTKDLKLTQSQARHLSINTTQIYTHVGEDEIMRAVEKLTC